MHSPHSVNQLSMILFKESLPKISPFFFPVFQESPPIKPFRKAHNPIGLPKSQITTLIELKEI